jgi:hypothetical protein
MRTVGAATAAHLMAPGQGLLRPRRGRPRFSGTHFDFGCLRTSGFPSRLPSAREAPRRDGSVPALHQTKLALSFAPSRFAIRDERGCSSRRRSDGADHR